MTEQSTTTYAADLFSGIPSPTAPMFDDICRFCDQNSAHVNAALPWFAAELGHNDGYATMLRVVRAWSGMRLYVPRDHEHFLATVGLPLCASTHRRLVRETNESSQIDVPSAWGVFLAMRRAAISIAVRSGMPAREVCRQFGVTMRSLR